MEKETAEMDMISSEQCLTASERLNEEPTDVDRKITYR